MFPKKDSQKSYTKYLCLKWHKTRRLTLTNTKDLSLLLVRLCGFGLDWQQFVQLALDGGPVHEHKADALSSPSLFLPEQVSRRPEAV